MRSGCLSKQTELEGLRGAGRRYMRLQAMPQKVEALAEDFGQIPRCIANDGKVAALLRTVRRKGRDDGVATRTQGARVSIR